MEGPRSSSHEGPEENPSAPPAKFETPMSDGASTPHPEEASQALQANPQGTFDAGASLVNAASDDLNAQLPPFADSRDGQGEASKAHPAVSAHPFRAHIRTPTAGLVLQTDIPLGSPADSHAAGSSIEQHPAMIHEGYLRTALSTSSMAGSLSPASALSSPALNALTDITPLPSPLVMSDSPGPWLRGGAPRSRGTSNASAKDDSFVMLANGTLSPSPSQKRKSYQRLQNGSSHARNRSLSELVPESMHNIRARNVTISGVAPEQIEALKHLEPHLHREVYLAAQRGLISATIPKGLPTPPASNASNRSVTESESEDVTEDDKIEYITVRDGLQKSKKLWRPVRQLGQGTFSKVYLATSERRPAKDPLDESALDPHKLVAIKIVEHGPAGGADEERVELSLKREVEMLRSISHPSLVHLEAFDNGESQALIVLSYCPGGDLFEVASAHGDVLRVDIVQRIFAELVSAVRYLHDKLIVHRDIKLENVLLNVPAVAVPSMKNPQSHPYPLVTLTDLGLSRRIPAPPASPLLTTRCGSEDYAAPEILLSQPYDGRATDAWALGVLLYALMEGRLPFDPPPGKVGSRSRAVHRIARCDWGWSKFGDNFGEWDPEKGKGWEGARECVEGLLKKVSRGRKSLQEIESLEWVKNGIAVEGGIRRRTEDEDREDEAMELETR